MQRAFGVEFTLVGEGNSLAYSTVHCDTPLSCVTQVSETYYNSETLSVANRSNCCESRRAGSPLANTFLTMSGFKPAFHSFLSPDLGLQAGFCHKMYACVAKMSGIPKIFRPREAPDRRLRPQRTNRLASSTCVDHRRSEEHTSELQSLMRTSYAVFCLK